MKQHMPDAMWMQLKTEEVTIECNFEHRNEETKSRVRKLGCLQSQWVVGVENRTGGQFAWVRIMMLWIYKCKQCHNLF